MDLISAGQKIALIFQKETNIVEMTCIIEKVYDDRLALQLPQYFMRYVEFFNEGAELTAKIFTKLGTIDFNTIVISSPLDNEVFFIELDYNALKLTPGDEIPFARATEKLEVFKNDGIIKLRTFELSTEYIKFDSNKKFEVGENIDCALILPEGYGTIKFRAEISEIDPIYENEYTAVFTTITENAKQALLYYMYMYENMSEEWE